MDVDDEIAHVGVVHGLLRLRLPGRVSGCVIRIHADDLDLAAAVGQHGDLRALLGEVQVAGSSPEVLVKVRGGIAVTHPASWGQYKVDLLRGAVRRLSFEIVGTQGDRSDAGDRGLFA